MDELNAELAAEAAAAGTEPIVLRIGVGVNTGDCVVGNMGSSMRFDYSVLGDSVNLAARLEGETKRFGVFVLLGEETARLVGDRLPVAMLDRLLVKGKTEPVVVSTVVPGADGQALAEHRALVTNHWEGRLTAGDGHVEALREKLPTLAGFYDGLSPAAGRSEQRG